MSSDSFKELIDFIFKTLWVELWRLDLNHCSYHTSVESECSNDRVAQVFLGPKFFEKSRLKDLHDNSNENIRRVCVLAIVDVVKHCTVGVEWFCFRLCFIVLVDMLWFNCEHPIKPWNVFLNYNGVLDSVDDLFLDQLFGSIFGKMTTYIEDHFHVF